MTDSPSVAAWRELKERKARQTVSYWAAASGALIGMLLFGASIVLAFFRPLDHFSLGLLLLAGVVGTVLMCACSSLRDDIVARTPAFQA